MTFSAPRRIAVCADDFGIDAGASQAILDLMTTQRLHSTSVLVFGGAAEHFVAPLRASLRPHQTIGLHFTLTEATHDGVTRSVGRVLVRSYLRLWSSARVRVMLDRQLDRFEHLFGMPPAYIDGHEHVHQFPSIRQAVVECVRERYGGGVALRVTCPRHPRGLKARVISMLGGRALERAAQSLGVKVNADFAGVYALKRPDYYRQHMQGWLATVHDGGVLMCHPGIYAGSDLASRARNEEHGYFRSAHWDEDRLRFGIELAAFRGTL